MRHPSPPADHLPGGLTAAEFDVIILGAGPVGENVITAPTAAGLRVAIVEAELVGGECSYWACMPSKALLRPVQVLEEANRIGGALPGAVGAGVDVAKVFERRDRFNSHLDDRGQVGWVEGTGATLVRGRARLAGERGVEVTGADGRSVTLHARHAVVICTGSAPSIPPIDGLAELDVWTNREATSAATVPASLLVIGGGPVGCEMAQAWSHLGSKVTLVEGAPALLANLEAEAGARLATALRSGGIDVHLGSTIVAARRDGDGDGGGDGDDSSGGKVLTLADGTELRAEEILVAAGRKPATAGIGLDTVGLNDGQALETDDTMTVIGVAGGWLYACGDCTTRAKLTHMGKYQARVCGDVIVARASASPPPTMDTFPAAVGAPRPYDAYSATADHTAVPSVVFTSPEVASVGLVEAVARRQGLPVRCVDYEIGNVAGASLFADDYDGWARLVIDTDRDVIVGATFVGPGVAELLHAATIAIVGEVPLARLWHAVPSYPTISEVWLRLLEAARTH